MTARRAKLLRLDRQLARAADPTLRSGDRKRAARHAAALAEQVGILARPKGCEWCRRRLPLERHHDRHDRPLAVLYLCAPCHQIANGMSLGEVG